MWLVEPPVARRATQPLTIAFSSTMCPTGVYRSPQAVNAVARAAAASVRAARSGVPGLTKLAPGRCSPITSISIWLEFAVP